MGLVTCAGTAARTLLGRSRMANRRLAERLALILVLLLAARSSRGSEFALKEHLTLSASDRLRGEFVSWFDPAQPNSNSNYSFLANQLRVGVKLVFPTLEIFVEGQDTRLVNLPGADSISPSVGPLGPGAAYFANTRDRDQGEVFLHRAYATVHDFGLPGFAARVGRFGYNHGLEKPPRNVTLGWLQSARISQRLVGNFDYTNVGRSFDGVQALYDHGPFNLTLMASHPTAGGFNVNANKHIDEIDLVSGTATLTEPDGIAPSVGQLFYVYYGDRRDLVTTDNRPRDVPTGTSCTAATRPQFRGCDTEDISISTVGGNLVHLLEAGPGTIDLLGWVARQFGDWESLDHRGWAYAFEAGYRLPEVTTRPWLRLGFFRSSGDDDPGDRDHGTFFQIIPTARVYALFPFFNLMNSQDFFFQAIAAPVEGTRIAVTGHWLRATESADLWYAGGGATSDTFFGFGGVPANGRHELSYLADLELSYTLNRHVTFYAYYGHAFGQGIVNASFVGKDADYGYLEMTLSL
jgi:hypothetical protein